MKCAIIGLIRGYDFWFQYKTLIKRNALIHKHFNHKYNYPVILFHEGNIKLKHQKKLQALSPNISFIEITDFHDLPYVRHTFLTRIFRILLKKCFNISFPDSLNGYKNMCTFYTYKLFNYLKDYDYYWRLDDDSFLMEPITYNPFEHLKQHNAVYGYLKTQDDAHQLTKTKLLPFLNNYIQNNNLTINPELISCTNYYNNFHLSKVSFWQQPEIQHFFKALIKENGIALYRWGDSTIQANILRMFANQKAIIKLPDIHYFHASHHVEVKTN